MIRILGHVDQDAFPPRFGAVRPAIRDVKEYMSISHHRQMIYAQSLADGAVVDFVRVRVVNNGRTERRTILSFDM